MKSRRKLHVLVVLSAALAACAVLACYSPAPWSPANAQNLVQSKRKVEKRSPVPNVVPSRKQERGSFTVDDEQAAGIPGIDDARAWGDSQADFARLLPQAGGPWLAISGGGSDGAYGGGLLAGWSASRTRPDFAVVTGVSIGALIAPFAFLGPGYDDEIRKSFATTTAADIFEDRVTRDSLFDDWPLKRLIDQRVTAKLLSEIAAEHARGRRLYVATTNLDAGRRMVWNMGAIAGRGDDRALELFRDVLLASAAIPGLFSPVGIEVKASGKKFEELHGDGTLTAPFFVVPESAFSASSTARPGLNELYVIVNSKLDPEFGMVGRSLPGVLGRSIAVALASALRAEIAVISVAARGDKIGVRVAHIDTAFNYPSRGPFDEKYMRALYDFGFETGKNGTAFEDLSSRRLLRRDHGGGHD
jgi:hypothetical protein